MGGIEKNIYDVLVSVELQGTFKVEASCPEEANEIMSRRWTGGYGGTIGYGDLEATNVQFDVMRG